MGRWYGRERRLGWKLQSLPSNPAPVNPRAIVFGAPREAKNPVRQDGMIPVSRPRCPLWILPFVGMVQYNATRPANLLRQRVRDVIMKFLHHQPGSSITAICRSTRIAWGTAQHHLYMLSRAGLVDSVVVGRSRAFFAGQPAAENRQTALLSAEPAKQIVQAIHQQPGLIQKQILDEVGINRKVFRHHITLLIAAGIAVETRDAKLRRYHPGPELPAVLAEASGTTVSRLTDGAPETAKVDAGKPAAVPAVGEID